MKKAQLSWLLSCYVLLLFPTINNSVLVDARCLNDQRSYLLQFQNNQKSDYQSSSTQLWNPEEDCCSWSGVGCDASGRVTTLDLNGGYISNGADNLASLFRLQFLEKLNLGDNYFYGISIPKAIENLTNLVYLDLSNSNFVGQVPIELSRLSKLVYLDLSYNSLKMENPNLKMLIQNLSNIEDIDLHGVDLSAQGSEWSQVIATSLPKLRVLKASYCNISGRIHSSLSSLPNLSDIQLDNNNIAAEVPEHLANMSNLRRLSLTSCNLVGQFPEKILQVPTLQILNIFNNKLLKGSLPPFPKNSSLRTIVLANTSFSGSLPISSGNLHMLSWINLSSCNFSGAISSANFTGFQSLEHLDLSNNFFSGRIPSSLFKLSTLKSILLSNNQFSGQIDEIPSGPPMSKMQEVDLSSNKLNGSFPKILFEFKGLQQLLLSSNSFNDTVKLETFMNLSNLTYLDLSYNNLTVETQSYNASLVHTHIQELHLVSCKLKTFPEMKNTGLGVLDLSNNQITGEIPNWIWNQTLDTLNLSSNSLVGFQQPYDMSSLQILDLHSNQLKGELPHNSSALFYVDFSKNNFSGPIPSDLTSFLFMSLSGNSLTGSIPDSMCFPWGSARFLDLSNNSLIGTIPSCLVASDIIEVLNLSGNNLSGSIPDIFPEKCRLISLELGMNKLRRKLPKTLSNCNSLEVLNLGNNKIEDVFPCMFENSSSLRVLNLRSNNFHGELECFGYNYNWPQLQIIDIASNKFTGVLSSQFFNSLKTMLTLSEAHYLRFYIGSIIYYQLKVEVTMKGVEIELEKILTIFTSIDFSNNKFSGNIPETIGDLKALYVLNLSHNAITGGIPSSMGKLSNIGSLDLSRNQLTGKIPSQLQDLTFLSYLNLSFNMLTGEIPTGHQLQTFSDDSYIGNVGLCGFPLNVRCVYPISVPSSSNKKEINWMYVCASLGYTVGLGIFVMFLLFCARWRNKLLLQIDQLLIKVFGPVWKEPIRRL